MPVILFPWVNIEYFMLKYYNCFSTVPGALDLDTPETVTATTITITGSVPHGSAVTSFVVQWQRDTSVGCSNMDEGSKTRSGSFNSYEITGLQPDSRYVITVTVFNTAGSVYDQATAMTLEAGKREINLNLSLFLPLFSAAPSRSLSFIRSSTRVTASSITVQWREIPCVHRNGEISYRVLTVRNGMVETFDVPGDTREATITGLSPSTQYTVQVAAVNSAGTGPFRGTNIMTSGE